MNTAEHMQELDELDNLIKLILDKGEKRGDRTETGTLSIFGYDKPLIFSEVGKVFPAVNKKNLAWNAMVSELLWFLSGSTNVNDLKALQFGDPNSSKRTIWCANAENEGKNLGYTDGELGPVYGKHMAKQLADIIRKAVAFKEDRRLVMSNWQDEFLEAMTLPPCHGIHTQFYISGNNELHLNTTMRSTDVFLGLPFNIASYALLLIIVASILGYEAGRLKVFLVGDTHIYSNHVDQCIEYLYRPRVENKAYVIIPEEVTLEGFKNMEYSVKDFQLLGYSSLGQISAPMAFKKN